MKCEIISIGTELLLGDILNTNAQYISKILSELGINTYHQTVVGDNKARMKSALEFGFERSDIIITTGGLGPTQDDMTIDVAAEYFGLDLVLNNDVREEIENYFKNIGVELEKGNIRQAYIPAGANIIHNKNGTAPGIIIEKDNKILILLPGPPKEVRGIFENGLIEYLKKFSKGIIKSKVLNIFGIGESTMESKVEDLIESQDNPSIAPYCMDTGVILRITARGNSEEEVDKLIDDKELEIRNRLGDYIYGVNNQKLEEVVVEKLIKLDKKLVLAESITGGRISNKITNIPGSSKVFLGSIISYGHEFKSNHLNIKKETLNNYGQISREVAEEMAKNIYEISPNADYAMGITGNAGPNSIESKPTGLVYISFYDGINFDTKEIKLQGDREKIKELSAKHGLNILNINIK